MRDPRRLGDQRVRVQIALGDLANPPSFRNALRGVETVVHLAATIRDQPRASIEELNAMATLRLVRAAERAGARRFLFFSAMGVLVIWRKPGNVLGWTMLVIAAWDGVGLLLTVLTGSFSAGADGVGALMWVQSWLWAPPIWAITTLLPMIYPDGRLPSRRWWWAVSSCSARSSRSPACSSLTC